MPEMDGIELARRASELDPDIKIMFITGFAAVALNPGSQAPKEAKGLSKPFPLRGLVNEVHKVLAARPSGARLIARNRAYIGPSFPTLAAAKRGPEGA